MARLLEDLLSLKQVAQVHYHTLATAKHPFDAEAYPVNEKLCVQHYPIRTNVTLVGASISLLKQESYNLQRFKDQAILQQLQKELKNADYDFVIFESLFTAVYARSLRPYSKAKFIYRAHNIEHQIWIRMIESSIVIHNLNMILNNVLWQCSQAFFLQFCKKEF